MIWEGGAQTLMCGLPLHGKQCSVLIRLAESDVAHELICTKSSPVIQCSLGWMRTGMISPPLRLSECSLSTVLLHSCTLEAAIRSHERSVMRSVRMTPWAVMFWWNQWYGEYFSHSHTAWVFHSVRAVVCVTFLSVHNTPPKRYTLTLPEIRIPHLFLHSVN